MKSSRLVVALALALPACALAQSAQPWVRVTLTSGERVEGALLEFSGRVWRVRLADGSERALSESRVRSLAFFDGPEEAARAQGSDALLAELMVEARESGALDALLGDHHLRLRQLRVAEDGGETLELEALVEARVSRDGDELRVRASVYPNPQRKIQRVRDLLESGAKRPYRVESRLGGDGSFLGSAGRCPEVARRVEVRPEGLRASEREVNAARGTSKGRVRWQASTAGQVEEAALYLVLAPLYGRAERQPCTLRVIRPRKPDAPRRVTRLVALPGEGASRRLELKALTAAPEDPSRTVLDVEPRGLLAIEHEDYGRARGASNEEALYVLQRRVVGERIDAEAFAGELEGWGLQREVAGPPAIAEAARVPAPGERELAKALRAALDGPARWFEARVGEERVLVGLRPEGRVLQSEVWAAGAPDSLRARCGVDDDGHVTRLEGAFLRRGEETRVDVEIQGGAWAFRAREVDVGGALPPDERTRSRPLEHAPHTVFSLAALVDRLDPAERDVPLSLFNVRSSLGGATPYRLVERSVSGATLPWGEDSLAVPAGLEPTRALGLVEVHGDALPTVVFWLGEAGLLGWSEGISELNARELREAARSAGRPVAHPVVFRPRSAAGIEALREDADLKRAYARRHRAEVEGTAAILLYDVVMAQEAYRAQVANREPGYAPSYAALAEAGLVRPDPERLGCYRVRVVRAEREPGRRCLALAEPLDPESGLRSFVMDQAFGVFASPTPIVPGPEARVPEGLERVR